MTDIVDRLRLLVPSDPSGAAFDVVNEIVKLRADNERLRAALKTISDMTDYGTETATWRMTNVIHNTNVIARAALEGT